MDDHGDITKKSKETITFSEANSSGKKTEIIEITEGSNAAKGHCVETTTTTDYKDGRKEISFAKSEVLTEYRESSHETIKSDGSSEKTTFVSKKKDNTEISDHIITKTYVKKDTSGKFISKSESEILSQAIEPKADDEILNVTTTTNYDNGEPSGIIVETFRPALAGCNDGSYIKETKDKDGITKETEMEYYFNEGRKKIIFKNDEAKITNGTFENGEHTHSAFVTTRQQYKTVFNIQDGTITIVSIDGSTVNKSYKIGDVTLSFGTKF